MKHLTLRGSFSAVSTATIARKGALFRIFRDLQDSFAFAPLRPQNSRKKTVKRFGRNEISFHFISFHFHSSFISFHFISFHFINDFHFSFHSLLITCLCLHANACRTKTGTPAKPQKQAFTVTWCSSYLRVDPILLVTCKSCMFGGMSIRFIQFDVNGLSTRSS